MSNNKKKVTYKCLYCDKRYDRENLVHHIDNKHQDMIPEGYTAFRLVFDYVNNKPKGYNGSCIICSSPTGWDEDKGKYNRLCPNPKCKEIYIKKFEENMMKKKGVKRISSTTEGQEKMLANRKISGTYKFKDGVERTYVGSYERKTLEFMDKVLNCNSTDVITPGPIMEYEYEGKKHIYISDIYYAPYNLIIEVKDGGNNPNNRDMKSYREKQIAKEEFIVKNTTYNYLRLTNNNFSQLLSTFAELKMKMIDGDGGRVININENDQEYIEERYIKENKSQYYMKLKSKLDKNDKIINELNEAMNALMTGYIPGIKDTDSVYIVNYMRKPDFIDHDEIPDDGFALSDSIFGKNLIFINKEGKLIRLEDTDFLKHCNYSIYKTNKTIYEVSIILNGKLGLSVSESYLYELVSNNKLYSNDQISLDESFEESINIWKYLDDLSESSKLYFLNGLYNNDLNYENITEACNNPLEDHYIFTESGLYSENKDNMFINIQKITEKLGGNI